LVPSFLSTKSMELIIPHSDKNSQSIDLLTSNFTVVIPQAIGGPVYTNTGNDILKANTGMFSGDINFKQVNDTNGISEHVVRKGDTLSGVAELFNVSINTIKWENNLKSNTLRVGQELRILPTTGVTHTIKKGDTYGKIAKKYHVDIKDITIYNDLDADKLTIGKEIIVPNGVKQTVRKTSYKKYSSSKKSSRKVGGSAQSGYYIRPAAGRISSRFGPRRRGYHYGIDFANKPGTPLVASHSGTVIKVVNYCTDNSGRSKCGGGYGNHIIIQHSNGTKTLYGHARKVIVSKGSQVRQGQKIGEMGNTGRSTGAHVHFEIIKSNGQKMNPNRLF
jgi:murein DD-endopeptidase MepM/ murein hydrolase activator NlpD